MTSMDTNRANKALHPTTIPLALHGGGWAWPSGSRFKPIVSKTEAASWLEEMGG